MLNVVIFGGPGSGKGTQSEKIAEKYNLFHISTGDVLRREVKGGSELGQKIDSYISKGNLIPDALMIEILSNVIDQSRQYRGVILDGFPRTIPQAEALKGLLETKGMKLSTVLALDVEKQELVNRLLKRGEISGRSDDNAETIQNRLDVYEKKTAPLIAYFKQEGLLNPIHGIGTIDDIFDRIVKAIDSLK